MVSTLGMLKKLLLVGVLKIKDLIIIGIKCNHLNYEQLFTEVDVYCLYWMVDAKFYILV